MGGNVVEEGVVEVFDGGGEVEGVWSGNGLPDQGWCWWRCACAAGGRWPRTFERCVARLCGVAEVGVGW